jgi:hypothetical protein
VCTDDDDGNDDDDDYNAVGAIIRCVWNWLTLWMLRNMQKKL